MFGTNHVVSRLAVVVGAVALVSATLASMEPASAQWHRSDVGAGIAAGAATGLALGAIAGAAASNGGYGYAAPAYDAGDGGCYWQRQRVWNGYGWQVQRVQVCE